MKNEKTERDGMIEVLFRQAAPIDVPEARYPGFNPSTTTLRKGFVKKNAALPLPCDILFERDVPVPLRDGTVIYTDIFRPVGGSKLPAIIAWSPYGKEGGMTLLDDFPFRAGVPKSAVSELQKWEGPDPAYWCNHGYAIVNLLEFCDRTALWKVSDTVELEFSARIGQSEETTVDAEKTCRCVLRENIRPKRKGLRQTG